MYEVYVITCAVNGKVYVGYTFKGFHTRFEQHLLNARWSRKGALCDAIRKHGSDAFTIRCAWRGETHVEACTEERRLIAEMNCMAPRGYNLTYGGDGVPLTREQYDASNAKKRGKFSLAQQVAAQRRHGRKTGKRAADEPVVAAGTLRAPALKMTRAERRFAGLYAAGLIRGAPRSPMTPEVREKIRQGHLGKTVSEETRAKIRAANLGKKPSAETIEKQRLASTGRLHSIETRSKMSRVQKGRIVSPEAIAKTRAKLTGRKRNPELIKRQKQTWVLKRIAKQAACTYFGGF